MRLLSDELRVQVIVLASELGHHFVVYLRYVLRRRLLVVVDEAAAPFLSLSLAFHHTSGAAFDGTVRVLQL